MKELKDIQNRLENGGSLRWYEKKGYNKFLEQIKIFKKKINKNRDN